MIKPSTVLIRIGEVIFSPGMKGVLLTVAGFLWWSVGLLLISASGSVILEAIVPVLEKHLFLFISFALFWAGSWWVIKGRHQREAVTDSHYDVNANVG